MEQGFSFLGIDKLNNMFYICRIESLIVELCY